MKKKKISIISPCYNEELNIEDLYERVKNVIDEIKKYDFEYLFIDNDSQDKTVEKLKSLAKKDPRIKIIVNNRNFGHIRSPYWGILQTQGDATIYLASDLQDPPEFIPQFIDGWENGYKVVMAVKPSSEDGGLIHTLRRCYYRALAKISEVPLTMNTTGFGLYDQVVVQELRKINDPYPYLRGLVDELGYSMKQIEFKQPRRARGITKNNFYTLYDMAMLGIVSHSMVPLRAASFLGFFAGAMSILAAFCVFILKLFWWDKFAAGLAPIVILMFFIFGLISIFIGFLGEYIGAIHNYVKKRPIVVEKERINF